MIKLCLICDKPIKDNDKVLVGLVTVYHELPSQTTWAVEKSDKFVFVNHAKCEDIDEQD